MSKSFLSPSWYRVADIRPRLRSQTDIHRQSFRGQVWYVLEDHATGRFHRFSPQTYFVIGLMNGRRSLDDIWQIAGDRFGEDVPTQDELLHLLSQLHSADVLRSNIPVDVGTLVEASQKRKRKERLQRVRNPMAIRLPLWDPDRFLTVSMPYVRPLFGWFGVVLWLCVVGYALLLLGLHWSDLTENVVDRVIATENLLLLALAYPPVKALHELGHGYATKRWGGEVHDIGVMFLVFFPVPYVDASAATAFRDKWHRAVVGASGILVEVFVAGVAMILWVALEPGTERSFLFNVMLISGVSTVLFNGNPLLRFDGYYVLADLIEIPNLGARSNQYLQYLAQRYLFGVDTAESPAVGPGEPAWFVVYGVAAFLYRMFIMVVIALFVASQFFIVGILLAIWSISLMVVVPLAKGVGFLFTSPRLARHRSRALTAVGGTVAAVVALLSFVPAPLSTIAEGIVWVPDRAILRADASGFVREISAEPGIQVAKGTVLVTLDDPLLDARIEMLEAEVKELSIRYESLLVTDLAQAEVAEERVLQVQAELDLALRNAAQLEIRSHADGQFILPRSNEQKGRFINRGEQIGYVVGHADRVIRTVVGQGDVELVRDRLLGVSVRYVESVAVRQPARVLREVPEATDLLPSRALSTMGGGQVYLDPVKSGSTQRTLATLFHFDLQPIQPRADGPIGGRVHVRFDHGSEPLAAQLYRRVRQLFLGTFDV